MRKGHWVSRLAIATCAVPIIYYLVRKGPNVFSIFLTAVACGAVYEYSRLRNAIFQGSLRRCDSVVPWLLCAANVCTAGIVIANWANADALVTSVEIVYRLLVYCGIPLVDLILPFARFPPYAKGTSEQSTVTPFASRLVVDWIYAIYSSAGLKEILLARQKADGTGAEMGISKVVFIIMTSWVSDAGALLIGGKLGYHRVLPALSPNKTLEGYIGMILFSLLSTFGMRWIGYLVYPNYRFNAFHRTGDPMYLTCLSLLCAFAGGVGDLVESALKRIAGVKDTSSKFGPHGGILDKIDSMIVASICLGPLLAKS